MCLTSAHIKVKILDFCIVNRSTHSLRFKMPSLSSISDPKVYHILTYGTLLGSNIQNTFFAGPIAYSCLPRPQFATLQTKIFLARQHEKAATQFTMVDRGLLWLEPGWRLTLVGWDVETSPTFIRRIILVSRPGNDPPAPLCIYHRHTGFTSFLPSEILWEISMSDKVPFTELAPQSSEHTIKAWIPTAQNASSIP